MVFLALSPHQGWQRYIQINTKNFPSISFNIRRRSIMSVYTNLFIYFSNLNITQYVPVMLIFFWGFATWIGNGMHFLLRPASQHWCWPKLTD